MVYSRNAPDRSELATLVMGLLPPDSDFLVVFRAESIKPSLTFGIINNVHFVPNQVKEVRNAIETHFSLATTVKTKLDIMFTIYANLAPGSIYTQDVSNTISHYLNTLILNKLSYFNHIEDQMSAALRRFPGEGDIAPDCNAFIGHLQKEFKLQAEMYNLSDRDDQVLSVCNEPTFRIVSDNNLRRCSSHCIEKGHVIEFFQDSKVQEIHLSRTRQRCDGFFYVFPVRSKSRGGIRTSDFVLARAADGGRLSVFTSFCVNQWIEEYVYRTVRLGQQTCLYWQTEMVTELVKSLEDSGFDQARAFNSYMAELAERVVACTQGHSFAYLSYDAAHDALSREVMTFSPSESAAPVSGLIESVKLRDRREYVSAHLFVGQSEGAPPEIYVKSVVSREEWRSIKMLSVRCRRNILIKEGRASGPRTMSEAAFIVHDQVVPIGVICVECPYRDGLGGDLPFLRQVVSNASVYRSFLFRIGDQRWLRKNLKLQDVVHELEKLKLVVRDPDVAETLGQINRDLEPDGDTAQPRLSMEERINSLLREEAAESEAILVGLINAVRVFVPDRHEVPHDLQISVIHIVRILLRNRVHCASLQPITVVTRDAHAGVRDALLIHTRLVMNVEQAEIDAAFRRPIRRNDRDHVGLYMIGVVVRAWGGRLDFNRSPGTFERDLEICIPLLRGLDQDG